MLLMGMTQGCGDDEIQCREAVMIGINVINHKLYILTTYVVMLLSGINKATTQDTYVIVM